MSDRANRAVVIRSTGSWYILRNEAGELFDARIKGKFRIKGLKTTNPVAVGDWVHYETDTEDENAIITEIEDRKNYIVRKSVNLSKQAHIIAANVDYALLVVTIANPRTSTGFIDRFLVTAEAYHITPILLFNKIDILTEDERLEMEYLIHVYSEIGYQCIRTSAIVHEGLEEVKEILKGKTSMFSGHSGAGKSSLINAIDETLAAKVGIISDSTYKGKHTTTFAEMFTLSFGGDIIDTPGIKGFGLVNFDKEDLNHYFIEMRDYLPNCKFNNCLHLEEPKCAVKDAVEEGLISPERYKNYVAIMTDDEEVHYRTSDYS
jgi:ribosome biogenesis GTPase